MKVLEASFLYFLLSLSFQELLISNGNNVSASSIDNNSPWVRCGWIAIPSTIRRHHSFVSSVIQKNNPNNLSFLTYQDNMRTKNECIYAIHDDRFFCNPQQQVQNMDEHGFILSNKRRKVMQNIFLIALTSITTTGSLANAAELADPNKNRPYSPTIEPLIPAVVVKLQLDTALQLANEFRKPVVSDSEEINKAKMQLMNMFEKPTPSVDPRPLFVNGSVMKSRYYIERQFVENKISSASTKDTTSVGIFLLPLSGKFVRSACNIYTANLRFSETYVLTADPATRKQLIRNDALPDIKTVITADLDLRDLYRNTIQTAIDDVQAELYTTNEQQPDLIEVQHLLRTAVTAMDQWLALVRPQDVQKAMETVQKQIISIPGDSRYQLILPDPYS